MTESEARYCLKAGSELHPEVCEECPLYGQTGTDHCPEDAYQVAIQALEEVQQYRAIGTVEELKQLKANGAFTGLELAQIAIAQTRLKEYQAIGTVEECRAAVDKQKAKKIERVKIPPTSTTPGHIRIRCTCCGKFFITHCDFCPNCGQKSNLD